MNFFNRNKLTVKILSEHGKLPTRNNEQDAGLDLYASEDVFIPQHETCTIKTCISVSLPKDTVGLICDRSSMGNKGLKVMGGVVDNTYRGEVMVMLSNITNKSMRHAGKEKYGYWVLRGDKVAQLLVIPILFPTPTVAASLSKTERNDKGWGSSGR